MTIVSGVLFARFWSDKGRSGKRRSATKWTLQPFWSSFFRKGTILNAVTNTLGQYFPNLFILGVQIFFNFFMLVLVRRTSFLTTFYGLYFSHLTQYILQIACWAYEGSFLVLCSPPVLVTCGHSSGFCLHVLCLNLYAIIIILSSVVNHLSWNKH